ncbi:MAG: SIMPL domain-containing protein [Candidatus Zixiibacteriota bacterium]
MFRKFAIALALCLLSISIISADDTKKNKPNSISVTGYVKVFAQADRATVQFDVKGEGSSLEQAFDRVSRKVDSIAARLYTVGLEQSELGTSRFRSAENEGHKAFLSSKRDYKTLMTVTIQTTKLDLLDKIIIVLSESEVEVISDISFDLINIEDIRMNALKAATDKAKEKATAMAEILGCRIIRPLEIIESALDQDCYSYSIRGGRSSNICYEVDALGGMLDFDNGTIFPDKLMVESEVTAEFEIEPIDPTSGH